MSTEEHVDRLERALDFLREGRRSSQYLLSKKEDEHFEYGVAPLSAPILNTAEYIFEQSLEEMVTGVTEGDKKIKQFSIVHTTRNITPVQYLPVGDLPDTARFDYLLSDPSLEERSYEDWPNPDLQMIRVKEPGGTPLLGIQEFTNHQVVGSSKPILFSPGDEQYDVFEDSLLTIPSRVNVVYFDGYIYVYTPKAFERMYDIRGQYEEQTDNVIDTLESRDIKLADDSIADTFKNDIRCLRRINEIKRHDIHEDLEPEAIVETVEEYDVPVIAEEQNGSLVLDIENGSQRWKLLDLLSDSYLRSEMTENQYNAPNKDKLN
ncbi:hypothetical protein HTSR_1728 [Halodesulfurarchaeum formicicum]|uniref:DUF4868 domain-containing protein n=1 Tax=Halodesulfurarchaeum formicicum TaxID=1873524 RepID=A0A1D8S6D5_9EURY|nr:Kiwa anti-phage protein KwaB-like domain-containing protein [Halodesulfurarchaeum formicicum]AOW80898.1 hypothetical protein HTSR_1728 [Halodesulfurarchaeum formicicum]